MSSISKKQYDSLLSNKCQCIILDESGRIITNKRPSHMDIFPGSFNPLHISHKELFNSIDSKGEKFFELSIKRFDKKDVALSELQHRLLQFKDYAKIIITCSSTFDEKITSISSPGTELNFHLGGDTLSRMKSYYSLDGIEALKACFVVYARVVSDRLVSMETIFADTRIPKNCFESNINRTVESMSRSSTKIRENDPNRLDN